MEHAIVAKRDRELVRNAFLPLGNRVLALRSAEGGGFREIHGRCEHALAGERLPYEDASFDHVLVRDVFHAHPAPLETLAEVHRVLSHGGRLDVLEARRGAVSTPRDLERMIARRFVLTETSRHQAMPLHRAVFNQGHSGRDAWLRPVLAVERALELLIPRSHWAFVHIRARRA